MTKMTDSEPATKADLKAAIKPLATKKDLKDLRTEMNTKFDVVHSMFQTVRKDIKSQTDEVKALIENTLKTQGKAHAEQTSMAKATVDDLHVRTQKIERKVGLPVGPLNR